MGKEWIIQPAAGNVASAALRWNVPPLVAQILLNRGVEDDQDASAFLSPLLKDLHPPHLLSDTASAAAIIVEAIRSDEKIVLYGDYDVDGITGSAILWHLLRLAGNEPKIYVPHRINEGYGVSVDAARQLARDGASLVVTVDCGITAIEAADVLRDAGVKLVVTDHHDRGPTLPHAEAIVHPRLGSAYPNPNLCGAGVAFKLAWAVAAKLHDGPRVDATFRHLLLDLLCLAALGTVADVVPLTGENRIIVRHGLGRLTEASLPGLKALVESAGLSGKGVTGYDAGFKLAPRINAAGRMGHADLAVELFTRATPDRAREIALYLDEQNRSRQAVERRIAKQAIAMIEGRKLAGDARRAIVVADEDWHAGVIGIVASRIVGRYHRPAVVIALSNGQGQGSARSIAPFDLSAALARCGSELIAHGGHAMAAGLRIASDRVEAFTEEFVRIANNQLTGYDLTPKLRIDAAVQLDALTLPTVEVLSTLGPFGSGNPSPRLATDWVDLAAEPRCVGKSGDHLQASFNDRGTQIRAIGFGLGSAIEDLKHHRRCRVAFEPMVNEFNGRRTVEMRMLDLRFPER